MSAGAAVALFCTCLDQEAVLCVALLPLTILSHRLLIIVFPWTSILGWSSSTSSSGHLVRSCSSWSSSALNDCSFLIWWTLYHRHNLRYPFTTFLLSKQPLFRLLMSHNPKERLITMVKSDRKRRQTQLVSYQTSFAKNSPSGVAMATLKHFVISSPRPLMTPT